jgi:hypothetical protein
LHRALQGLALCALLALVYVGLGYDTPQPQAANWQQFAVAGYRMTAAGRDKPASTSDMSHGEVVRFDLTSLNSPQSTWLMSVVPIRVRGGIDLDTAYFNKHMPAVASSIGGKSRSVGQAKAATTVSIGLVDGKGALQTCITASGRAGTSSADLTNAIGNMHPQGVNARIRQLLGLQRPVAWECALVTIVSTSDSTTGDELVALWQATHTAWVARPPWP